MLAVRSQLQLQKVTPWGADDGPVCLKPAARVCVCAHVQVGEAEHTLPLVERLLRCENEAAHARIADLLWDAGSDAEALQQLEQLAQQELAGWEQQLRERGGAASSDDVTAEG